MYNLFVDRNIDNERGPAIVDDLKQMALGTVRRFKTRRDPAMMDD